MRVIKWCEMSNNFWLFLAKYPHHLLVLRLLVILVVSLIFLLSFIFNFIASLTIPNIIWIILLFQFHISYILLLISKLHMNLVILRIICIIDSTLVITRLLKLFALLSHCIEMMRRIIIKRDYSICFDP
jgi:hypothetical protein